MVELAPAEVCRVVSFNCCFADLGQTPLANVNFLDVLLQIVFLLGGPLMDNVLVRDFGDVCRRDPPI